QEGCSATATVTYRVKNRYCNEPYSHEPIPCDGEKSHLGAKDVVTVRKFCAHHSKRGDAAFDDSDANYELISGAVSEPKPEDVKPAVFGGVIELKEETP